ncbi:MAG TPA: histidine phosphatase family protein [Patescibacteria group bacterium]|nr:histidine phosphatase family protein [Patescibacteria group bacterium]
MKLYLVRHGETDFNAGNMFQPLDSKLSKLGLKQAEFIAQRFKNIPIDTFMSSDLKRAKQTAEIINKVLNKEIIWSKLFREMKRPSEFIGKFRDDPTLGIIKKLVVENSSDSTWHYSDEENIFDLNNRAKAAMELIEKAKSENVLVLTHGEFMRIMVARLIFGDDMTYRDYERVRRVFKTINTGITILDNPNGKWRILTWNDHSHLG